MGWNSRASRGTASQGDLGVEEGGGECWPKGCEEGFVDEESFRGVAGGRVGELPNSSVSILLRCSKRPAHLGVEYNSHCLLDLSALVDVHCAESIGVAHDGDPGTVLDPLDECCTTSWDDEVDVAVLGEQRGDI
jgi:hypothetical protein